MPSQHAASGATDSDTELFRRIYTHLRKFAAVAADPDMDPDDVVQEAVARALRVGRLCDFEHPLAYLRQAILSIVSNHRRARSRRRIAMLRISDTDGEVPPYPSDLAELFRLSPKDRAILYLADVEQTPMAEIAIHLGCTEVAVRKAASRARQRLRRLMLEESE